MLVYLFYCSPTEEAAKLTSEQSITLIAVDICIRVAAIRVITIPCSVLTTWFGALTGAEAS
jgi:hypothetical protein